MLVRNVRGAKNRVAFGRSGAIKVIGQPYVSYFFSSIIPIDMNQSLIQIQCSPLINLLLHSFVSRCRHCLPLQWSRVIMRCGPVSS